MTKVADISIVMFDDQGDHRKIATLLSESTGYDTHFVDLQDKSVIAEVETAITSLRQPDLALVDHILNRALGGSAIQKGSSIVPLLREKWPATPILCVTAAYEDCLKDIASENYEAVFRSEKFSALIEYLPSIISGYRVIRDKVRSTETLCNEMGVPETERSILASALPASIKNSFGQPMLGHHIFRWFRRTFHREPGFLLDKQWSALSIGVAPEYFDTYEPCLEKALYNGLFTDGADPRWWKSTLYSLILPQSSKRFTIGLCEAASEKFSVPVKHQSVCHRCAEKWPEVMGYTDEAAIDVSAAVPLHLHCSKTHSLSAVEPFYEECRVMLEDK